MDVTIEIQTGVFLLLALLILILPLNWLASLIFAGVIHECCHLLALGWTGARVHSIGIGMQGTVIRSSPLERRQELVSALAGPAGSLLLWLLYPVFPKIALCALAQGLFNLIPVYPMDGGRALRCIFSLFPGEETAIKLQKSVALFCGAMLVVIGCVLSSRLGAWPLVWVGFLLFRVSRKNTLQIRRSRGTINPAKK